MQLAQPAAIAASFDDFHAHFATCFQRSETRQRVRSYVRGLLAQVKRKNCWQIAEVMGERDPQGFQRLLYEALWDADEVCGRLRGVIRQRIGYTPGIGVIDESGFVKKGSQSVGVKRQYCGRLGKVENCQVGVFLGYVAPQAHALLDRELYLPREWCADGARRRAAHVPDSVVFCTKPQLAQIMLARAWTEGIEMQWVSADTTYGNSAPLRDFIHQQGRFYVMGVTSNKRVTLPGEEQLKKLPALVDGLLDSAWERLAVGFGEKGLDPYDWVARRVVVPTDTVGEQWLLVRRSVSKPTERKYFVSNAPADTPVSLLVQVAATRHHVEELLEEARSQVGLAEYEVRHWHSWYRHMTLAMMAHTWLTLFAEAIPAEKKEPAALAAPEFRRTLLFAQYPVAPINPVDG
jgi:SRSO17 transposase